MSNDLAHIFRLCSFGRFGNHTVAITQVLGRFQQHNLVACWNERGAFFISSLYSSAQKITLKGAPFFARALLHHLLWIYITQQSTMMDNNKRMDRTTGLFRGCIFVGLFLTFWALRTVVTMDPPPHVSSDLTMSEQELSAHLRSSVDYSWIGDQWIPPPNVPMFTPDQIHDFFASRNVLFIGDSTTRRAYATIYGILNATDPHDIKVNSVDDASVTEFNKYESEEHICNIPGRQLFQSSLLQNTCRNVPPVLKKKKKTKNQEQSSSSSSSSSEDQRRFQEEEPIHKFDFVRINCHSEVYDYISNNGFYNNGSSTPSFPDLQQDYDLIIFGLGSWENAPNSCRKIGGRKRNAQTRHAMALEAIYQASSPSLQMVYRTVGFNKAHWKDSTNWMLIHETLQFAKNMTQNYPDHHMHNFSVVDWGTVIHERSFGDRRIEGDTANHYGLQGRMLFVNQLLQSLTL